jgi:hypothetical protein
MATPLLLSPLGPSSSDDAPVASQTPKIGLVVTVDDAKALPKTLAAWSVMLGKDQIARCWGHPSPCPLPCKRTRIHLLQTYDVYVNEPKPLAVGESKHVISVFVADEAGLINRVAGVFARRGRWVGPRDACIGQACAAELGKGCEDLLAAHDSAIANAITLPHTFRQRKCPFQLLVGAVWVGA